MDKISAIRSFVEVANCGSFTQAAEQLGLSRLQVSRHIKDVEQWLALRLLHRTTRRVSLTLQGEEALNYCQRILSEVAAMESRANSHNNELVGSIRIASPIGLGQHKLFDVVEAFCQQHWEVIDETRSHALEVKGHLQANEVGVLIKAALRGNGIVCLPTDLANTYLEQGELIDVLPHTTTPGKTLWAVYLSRSYQQNVVHAFIDFTANAWQDDIDKWQR
ncbi:LysR family transcriptional regulator [Shewanella algicola]|uniref:LysR family transcriptional regulator n=1 Tax=Shewanella algicola TaxID=640633 RepID=UPI0024942E77|nr:LysR family transcriptional regulator [Shewanella algicola]